MPIRPRPERNGLTFSGWTLVIWLICLPWAAAQEVVIELKNGDRVSGEILNEDTNQVVISTKWAKELVVPVSEILKRSTLEEDEEPPEEPPPEPEPPPKPAAPPPKPPPEPAVKPKPPKRWFADLQMGSNLLFGERTQQVFTGRLKLTYKREEFNNVIDYLITYGQTDGTVTANRMDGSIKTDFDYANRLYVYNLTGAGYDESRRIDVRYEAGPGLGYRLLRRERWLMNLESGLNYQVQEFSDDRTTRQFFLRLAEDATWKVSPRLTIDEKFEDFPNVGKWGSYRFRFESNLRYLLANNITLNFTVIDQYDTTRAPGVQRNDLQLRSSLGMKF